MAAARAIRARPRRRRRCDPNAERWRCGSTGPLPLIARRRAHLRLFRIWLILYAFVGIQMGWVLRPFVGAPGQPVQFFREDSWGNAYVVVARLVWDQIAR